MENKLSYSLILKLTSLNTFFILFVTSCCAFAYILNTLSYYPESDNVGVLLVPMITLLCVFPFILLIMLIIEGSILLKRYRMSSNMVGKSILITFGLSLVNIILVPIFSVIFIFLFGSIIYTYFT